MVLRGGNDKPNYDATAVAQAENELAKCKVSGKIMIDSNHANSNKDPYLQPMVIQISLSKSNTVIARLLGWWWKVISKGGRQEFDRWFEPTKYGKSITDGCINWDTTVKAMHDLRDAIKDALPNRELND